MSEKEQFLRTWENEVATTLKVLRAYPPAKVDLKPHGKARSAKDLAWTFVFEGTAGAGGAEGKLEFPPKLPAPPAQWDALVSECERAFRTLGDTVRKASDADLNKTVKFFVAPKTMGDVRRLDFLWLMLMDMVHHRGQFSVYLRMADGKVPSIYGPSADEPWM
ncbi:MAG: hypothetical protein AUH78_11400 [Gemmatimonadetes bacterium 13_1_40CM_4_69_8]|nr:MAG: hypothetical protein AUH46_00975 [Gemmatimonadetes bacterium 13_1_40CM_70_15]OLC74400.1 MAG: hypothetical protein AUH78_11400 [Gemmatimonadetes bacterium 13_1_40CM_4_69_8]PYP73881.1 MAG: hypothetical protein DMD41_03940 [Gemmatimonadota bacterium]